MNDLLSQIKPYSVTLSVQDVEGMACWYEQKIGFREVKRKSYPEFHTSLIFLELNGYRVELIRDETAKPGIPHPDPPAHTSITGVSQFCFQTDDLDAVASELVQKDVPVIFSFQNEDLGAKFLFVRDPEENLIQFLQPL